MRLKRLIYGSLLSLSLFTTCSLFNVVAATNGVVGVYAGNECLAAEFYKVSGASSYTAYIKGGDISSYQEIDDQLVRVSSNNVRVDAVGLKTGTYSLKLVSNTSAEIELTDINVKTDDRSGYAFHGRTSSDEAYTGIGAYKDDGTLKNNAKVIYVTEATKNNIDEDGDGIGDGHSLFYYLNTSSASQPLDVRIIGTISAPTLTAVNTTVSKLADKKYDVKVMKSNGTVLETSIEEYSHYDSSKVKTQITVGGYGSFTSTNQLEGLRSKITYGTTSYGGNTYKDYDSYFNMMDIDGKSNITIEGIGIDATISQWGFTWKRCKSIEIKNLTFENYTEDACSFEGDETKNEDPTAFQYCNYWIHNNTFNRGNNGWDVSFEQDKADGDGATDFKGLRNVTVSYNHYYDNHKTGLVGGSDNHFQANFTFHHNYYDQCKARLPFARQANMHMYNNYYYKSSDNNMQVYAGAYAFIENCYFKDIDKTFILSNEYFKTNDTVPNSNKTYYKDTNGTEIALDSSVTISGSKVKIDGKDVTIYEKRSPAVKSYNNVFDNCNRYNEGNVLITNSRTSTISNGNFVSSSFDNDSSLFYLKNDGSTNVSVMNTANELPTLIPNVAGAGILKTTTYTITGGSSTEPEPVIDQTPVYNNTSYAKVLDEDFSVEKTIIETESTPTTAGIYKRIVAGQGGEGSINMSYSNSRLYLNDNNTKNTLHAYYMFEETNRYNSGVVKYEISLNIPQNGSWRFIEFMGTSLSFGSTETDKYLGYYDTEWHAMFNSTYTANTDHVFTLTIDYNNKKAYLDIDASSVEIDYNTTTAISGIHFVTASGSRSFYVNSISITKDTSLKLGYQLGSYTQNNNTYYALRIIGKIEYNDIYADLDDIESIKIDIVIENADGVQTKVLNKNIDNVYKTLKISSGETITESGDNLRYYYTVIKGITSAHSGYNIKATSTLNLSNGVKVECSGFTYEIQ